MVALVDLSAPVLHPDSVIRLIKEHAAERPPSNILFRVSRETSELYRQGWPKDLVFVSPEEAARLNAFLGQSWQPQDYAMGSRHQCQKCGRLLTFYDVFESGRKRHGDRRMKEILGANEYHLQVAGQEQSAEIQCTKCGETLSTLGHLQYLCNPYCYV